MPFLAHHSKERCSGFSLIELLLTIGIVALLAVIASTSISTMTERAAALKCVTNLKELGGAIQRFAIDHQGRLPVRLTPINTSTAYQWHREIWPTLRHDNDTRDWGEARTEREKANYKKWQFHCPADRLAGSTTNGLSYTVNGGLADARMTQLHSRHVLLLEVRDRYVTRGSIAELKGLANRHRTLNHVLFGDYRIEALKADEVPNFTNAPEAWSLE